MNKQMTVGEVAHSLGVTRSRVYKMIDDNVLSATQTNGQKTVSRLHVDEYVKTPLIEAAKKCLAYGMTPYDIIEVIEGLGE